MLLKESHLIWRLSGFDVSRLEDRHRISTMAEVVVRCTCGWHFRPDKIRGVAKERIDMELLNAFEDHLARMRLK